MLTKQKVALVLGAAIILFAISFLIPKNNPELESVVPTESAPTTATSGVTVIGASVENREIVAHRFGTGDTPLLFVGGIHGGYEANTVTLANQMITAFTSGAIAIPDSVTVHIIPVLNPDGYAKALDPVTNYSDAAQRFNANAVDLNRNFDCRWQPTSSWRGASVDAGATVFSEPEAIALRDYVRKINPAAAIFWHSQANNVYGSECREGVSPQTLTLVNTYASAADYGAVPVFDAYTVTGAAEDWLASLGVPAVTVELETRTDSEYERNRAGTIAVLELYATQ